MKKDMFTIIKKEFARFFGDKRLVFTTVLMPGLLLFVLYTLMGKGMTSEFSTDDEYVAKVYVQNMPEELSLELNSLSAEWLVVSDVEVEKIKEEIVNKKADVLLIFPEDFMAKVEAYEVDSGVTAPNVAIYYNSTESESSKIYSLIVDILNVYEESMANRFDINSGDESYDMATDEDVVSQFLSMMLPMLLMTFLVSACSSVAPESIAGEKERGTIATLLVTPMKRSALALGKIISLSCIALLSGISSFVGTMLSLPSMLEGTVEGVDVSLYKVSDYMLLLGIILTTVMVLVALIAVISASTRTVKEAATAVSPLMLLVMGIGLLPMFTGSGEKSFGSFFIPLYNSVQCMHGVFSFDYEPIQMLASMVVNIGVSGILVWVLTKMFNNEKIMFAK
ncbi:MAG: ABC transporter permease [Lachnospiraceae bacterium]